MSNNIGALIQTFTPRSDTVGGADNIVLMHVDLFFKAKPKKHNNKSGIDSPGVIVYICQVVANQPDPNKYIQGSKTRVAYDDITAVSDASVATRVAFTTPVRLATDLAYGIVVVYEDPDYQIWENVQGDTLVGSSQKSSGAAGLNSADGSLYEYTTSEVLFPLINTNLKFSLAAAQLLANTYTFDLVNQDFEFLNISTANTSLFHGGELVFQLFGNAAANVTNYQTGTLVISRGNTAVVGKNGTQFTSILDRDDYFVTTDGTDGNTDVRQVAYVANDTYLVLTQPPKNNFSSINFIKSVTGAVYDHKFIRSQLILKDSTANSTMFFNDSGLDINGFVNGTGYNNTDVLTISGGSINATANIVTNGSGAIKSLNFSNVGTGFANISVANVLFSNATGHNSAGTGASLTIGLGGKIIGYGSRAKANLITVTDQPVHQFDSEILTLNGSDTSTNIVYNFAFTNSASNTTSVDPDLALTDFNPGLNSLYTYPAMVMSRSHEVLTANNLLFGDDKRSAIFQATLNTDAPINNSLFSTPTLYSQKFDVFSFVNDINQDTTNEINPHGGKASCKHISTPISFANTAEDLIVYIDAWKPLGTDLVVYAKIWNLHDNDAFDDKYWTPMVQTNPNSAVFSSLADETNSIQYTYQFSLSPPSNNTITGSIAIVSGQANVTGANTTFTTDLTVGNLFKLYDQNHPNTNYWIGVVNSVVNNTLFTSDTIITNPSINGAGFAIDNLQYNYTAFNNINNDNVVRYYTSTGSSADGFDTVAVKVVLLAANSYITPIVHDLRVLGVSA